MDDQAIRKALLSGIDYSYRHDDWVTPLDEVLEGLTADQAFSKPGWAEKAIWEIVLHLSVWNENMVARVETGAISRPVEGAWPAVAIIPDKAAWDAAQQRLCDSLASLRRMIEETPLERIQASPYGIDDLICRFTHVGYHIGQMTKLREYLTGER